LRRHPLTLTLLTLTLLTLTFTTGLVDAASHLRLGRVFSANIALIGVTTAAPYVRSPETRR
jgi:hypothetical protein